MANGIPFFRLGTRQQSIDYWRAKLWHKLEDNIKKMSVNNFAQYTKSS